MNRPILPLIMLVTVAGCSKEPTVEAHNASVSDVANQVAEATEGGEFIRPGKWASTMVMDELSAPNMPPEMAAHMKSVLGQERKSESCLTPEQVNKPKEDFFAGQNNNCRYDHFKMAGGKIDAKMRCSQGGVSQVMEMAGTYGPDSYSAVMSAQMEGMGSPGAMTMRMHVSAKRVGECTKNQS